MPEIVPPEARPAGPDPAFTPERVIRTFLEGFCEPDVPTANDGLRTAFALSAWPEDRGESGFERFLEALDDPAFAALVGHEYARRGPLDVSGDVTAATQEVSAIIERDPRREYMYDVSVEKQAGGRAAGCWLVTGIELTEFSRRPGFEHQPTVEFDGVEVKCEPGTPLRDVLLQVAGVNPHAGTAAYVNCSGNGMCGTCAVEVEGPPDDVAGRATTATERTRRERARLDAPPFRSSDVPNLRLSCQTRVYEDVRVRKHGGLWGQHLDGIEDPVAIEEGPAPSGGIGGIASRVWDGGFGPDGGSDPT